MTTLSPALASSLLSRPLNRSDLGMFVLALFFVAVQPPLETSVSLLSVVDALGRQNLFFLFALLVAATRFIDSGPTLSLTRRDWMIAVLACLFFGIVGLFGVDQVAGLVLTLAVPALYFSGPRNLNFNAALLVCAALAINSFWGPLLFQSFTGEIISLDTTLLKWTYGLLRPDIVANGTTFSASNAFGIIVVGGCSVFNSASVAFLASTAMAQHLKPGFRKRDALVLVGVLLAMVLINTFRLALMGWGKAEYEFWHNGQGTTIFAALQTLLIAVIAYCGARWSIRKSA
ncbi:MAG: hypothetical protein ABIN69_17550 [Aestuariivirga sp.]